MAAWTLNSMLASDLVSGSRSFADGLAVAHLRRPRSIAHSRIPTLLGIYYVYLLLNSELATTPATL